MSKSPTKKQRKELGAAIKARRTARGLTQGELCHLMNGAVGISQLSNVEQGESHPSLDLYLKICAALEMPKPPFAP